MRKFFTLLFVLSMLLAFSGCTKTDDLKDNTNNGANVGDKGKVDENKDNSTDIKETGIPQGAANDDDYITSIKDIDSRFRKALDDMAKDGDVDVNDSNYLTKRGDYYTNTAKAYRTALDEINKTTYTDENKAYHNALVDYYRSGYDTYNNLAKKYSTFKSVNDETAYKAGEGRDAYDISDDLKKAYEDALRKLGIDFDKTNGKK